MPHCLVVIYGADVGRRYDIVDRPVIIGRDEASDIHLPQATVSRRHATLEPCERGVKLCDKSCGGTYVNDHEVDEVVLQHGDVIKMGSTIFKVLAGDDIDREHHEELRQLTTTDPITGAFNQRHLMHLLELEVTRAQRYHRHVALAMIELDPTEDATGPGWMAHEAWRQLAERLNVRARKVDLIAHWEDGRFVVVLPETDRRGALRFGEALLEAIQQEPFTDEGQPRMRTASVGVAELLPDVADAQELVRLAEHSLNHSRQRGGHRVTSAQPLTENADRTD